MSDPNAFDNTDNTAPVDPAPADPAPAEPAAPTEPPVEARPEWLPEQFKTPEALAQSYVELQKKFSSTRPAGAPDKYEFDMPEGVNLTEDMTTKFKELKLSNEQAQAVMGVLAENAVAPMREMQKQLLSAEIKAAAGLTDDNQLSSFLGELKTWAVSKYGEEEAMRRAGSAAGVMEMHTLRSAEIGTTAVPGTGGAQGAPAVDYGKRLTDIRDDPDYYRNTTRGKQLREEAYKLTLAQTNG